MERREGKKEIVTENVTAKQKEEEGKKNDEGKKNYEVKMGRITKIPVIEYD